MQTLLCECHPFGIMATQDCPPVQSQAGFSCGSRTAPRIKHDLIFLRRHHNQGLDGGEWFLRGVAGLFGLADKADVERRLKDRGRPREETHLPRSPFL